MTVALDRRHDNRAHSARALPKVGKERVGRALTGWMTR
jgi:hypothetical protein